MSGSLNSGTGGGGGGGGGDSDGGLWESTLSGVPPVLRDLSPKAKSLLREPEAYIAMVVLELLVGGIIDVFLGILGPILDAGALVAEAIGLAGLAALGPLNLAVSLLGGILEGFVAALLPLINALGPAGPFVAVLVMFYVGQALVGGTEFALTALWPALGEIFAAATSWLPGRGD